MKAFIDEIIKYLDEKFNADFSLAKKPKGHYAYEFGLKPSTEPYYEVQCLSESDTTEDFTRLVTTTADLQINLYGVKTKVNNNVVSAQQHAMILADKCENFMQEYKYESENITSMRKTVRSSTIPYEDGSKSYTTAIRYRIQLKYKEN